MQAAVQMAACCEQENIKNGISESYESYMRRCADVWNSYQYVTFPIDRKKLLDAASS